MNEDGYRFQGFECAPGVQLRAHERLCQVHYDNLGRRLERMEQMIERLERRLWFTVYGVAAGILAQAFQSILS